MPRTIAGHFDSLTFMQGDFDPVEICGATLRVRAYRVHPGKSYPIEGEFTPLSGTLVFRDVVSSTRNVTEYVGSPKSGDGFKEPYKVTDICRNVEPTRDFRQYRLEGLLRSPMAWIDDWLVVARSFEFEIDDSLKE